MKQKNMRKKRGM